MATKRTVKGALVPVGFQAIAATTSAVAVNSTLQDSHVLHISVTTTDARYRADGTDPTNNTGVILETGNSPYWFEGYNGTSVLKFIRSGGSGTSNVDIMGYNHPGD